MTSNNPNSGAAVRDGIAAMLTIFIVVSITSAAAVIGIHIGSWVAAMGCGSDD